MDSPPQDGAQRFAAVLGELEGELDWKGLGRWYCHDDGESFFSPAQVEAQGEAGLRIAAALGEALVATARAGGRSLYVGAALAELTPALCEVFVLGREVVLLNLPGPEPDEINRAFARVEERLGGPLPRIRTGGLSALEGSFDHGWLVSVLTDPDAFPALHDRLYGRSGADAAGTGDVERETRAARRLLRDFTARLQPPAVLTTTDEELGLVGEACRARGWRLAVPAEGRLSAVVGDTVRHCAVLSDP